MKNFKIFLRDGKLWGNEFPEIPTVSISANQDAARMRSYNRSVESACSTAIEVIGIDESALIINGFVYEDDFYSVPQGWTVDIEHGMTPGWVPSYNDPDNRGCVEPAEPCHYAKLVRVSSGIVATGLTES